MKLTLQQYAFGAVTGFYPGDEGKKEKPTPDEQQQWRIQSMQTVRFLMEGRPGWVDVTALSLSEIDGKIAGLFQDKEGVQYMGYWNHKISTFVGARYPFEKAAPQEVEYKETITAWPTGATWSKCDSWSAEASPIHLTSSGQPMRQVFHLNACNFTWTKLHGGGEGWVQDSD